MMNMVTNTTKNPNPEWLLGMNPRAIQNQEKEGQTELVKSELIPVDMLNVSISELINLGFEIGDIKKDDSLFRKAILPDGWIKKETSHDMWSEILDEKGKARYSIFYKAAFYDRRATIYKTADSDND